MWIPSRLVVVILSIYKDLYVTVSVKEPSDESTSPLNTVSQKQLQNRTIATNIGVTAQP
jgi:hypothetical protein